MENFQLPAGTRISSVRLQVKDIARSLLFYGDLLGLTIVRRTENEASVSSDATSEPLIELVGRTDAIPKPHRTSGLYHIAVRYPHRRELAQAVNRLANHRWTFQGFADHLVSEAIYLADPDENGVELYRDRPRDQWKWANGQIVMATEPLDVDNLMAELKNVDAGPAKNSHPVDIGHVHLHVANLARAEDFYHRILGFDVMQRSYPGALFLSAGGYHHHIGVNVWAGQGVPPSPDNAVGLISFRIAVPDPRTIEILTARMAEAGLQGKIKKGEDSKDVLVLDKYDGIQVEVSSNHD